MQQFIYHGGTKEGRADAITRDFPSPEYTHTQIVAEESSIKISQIRDLISSLSVTHQGNRLIWIEEASDLTLPAQQALLKTLEEPPVNTVITLSLHSSHSLLPTVRSRCALRSLQSAPSKLEASELALVKHALTSTPGERLQLASSVGKKRDPAVSYFTTIIRTLHQVMQDTDRPSSLTLLTRISELAHNTLSQLKSNTNVTLATESFFLKLPQTH